MPRPRSRGQSGLAVGLYWATRISTIGFQMAVPPAIGYWLDAKLGTAPWLVITGACLGFAIAMLEIARLAKQLQKPGGPPSRDRPE